MKNIKNINYPFDINKCKFFLTKEGKYIYYPLNQFNIYYCMLKNILYGQYIKFPNLVGVNEDDIIKKLLIIAFLQKQNFKYILDKKNNKESIKIFNYINILLFNNSKKYNNNIILYYFLNEQKNIIKIKKELKKNKIRHYNEHYFDIMIEFIKNRIIYSKKIKNNDIFIKVFYGYYILLKDKFKNELENVSDYHSFYLIMKKKGIVNLYYKDIVPYVLKNYKNIIKKLLTSQKFKKEKINILKKVKNFKDININNLINKYVNKKYDKKYIKNKFIELSKKYNI